MADFKGGRLSITVDGKVLSARASGKIKPSTVEIEADANQDSTGYGTVKPVLAEFDFSFDRGESIVWDKSFMLRRPNVTFVEDDAGITHLGTRCYVTGAPEIDSASGEVSGIVFKTDAYQQVSA